MHPRVLNDELSLEPKYDLQELASLCANEGLGQSLYDSLPADLVEEDFKLRDYDINPEQSTSPDITIKQGFDQYESTKRDIVSASNPPSRSL